MLRTRWESIERLFIALLLWLGEQTRTVDDSDESSSKPGVNMKFAIIRALNDAPLLNTEAGVWLITGTT
jgi:hypothetical protein